MYKIGEEILKFINIWYYFIISQYNVKIGTKKVIILKIINKVDALYSQIVKNVMDGNNINIIHKFTNKRCLKKLIKAKRNSLINNLLEKKNILKITKQFNTFRIALVLLILIQLIYKKIQAQHQLSQKINQGQTLRTALHLK